MKHRSVWMAGVLIGVWTLAGCKNDNLFGGLHKEGSGDAEALIADAQVALEHAEYSKALDYFNRALDKDSRNSEALYGAAVAEMGMAGLDIGKLIANLIATNSPLSQALSQAARGGRMAPAAAVDPDSILNGINVAALDQVLPNVIDRLETIRVGLTDNKIPPDDANLLINLAVSRLLKAATRVFVADPPLVDIRTASGRYEVVVLVDDLSSACDTVNESADDVIRAYQALQEVVRVLKLASGSTLSDLESDANDLFGEFVAAVGGKSCTVSNDLNTSFPPGQ